MSIIGGPFPEIVSYADTNLPTVEDIRGRWAFGLPLTDSMGNDMDDDVIQDFLDAAISRMEAQLGLYLKPTIVATNPEERGLSPDTYEVSIRPYDYEAKRWNTWGFLQLLHRHVNRLMTYWLALPNGRIVVDFTRRAEWIKLDRVGGQVQLVPYAGDPTLFSILGGSQSGFPFVTGMIHANIPHMIYADYVTGYELGKVPKYIADMVAKIATVDVLSMAGDALMAGISSQSISLDGMSESYTTTATSTSSTYGSRINQLKDEIDDFFDPRKTGARTRERGITMIDL